METEDSGPRRHTTKSKTHFELRGNVCTFTPCEVRRWYSIQKH